MSPQSPVIAVAEAELQDLRSRLRQTQWPTPWPEHNGQAGVDSVELRRLVDFWALGYDWRRHEAAINELPWHRARLGDAAVQFLRFEAEVPGVLPLILTHGWPSSVLELVELAHRLATPSLYGGSRSQAFEVIVPALPGFPFTPQAETLPPAVPTHELWHQLMHDELGFDRYGAHGGDLGAGVTGLLAQAHPEAVVGIHLLAVAAPADLDAVDLTQEERDFVSAVETWTKEEGGYQHQQSTRPVTLAVGLSDSPAGLLAWLLEKYRAWSDDRRPVGAFTDDVVLTQASLYWFTRTISTSFRPYYEYAHGLREPLRKVTVPTGLAVFPGDLTQPPRSWAERSYHLVRYTRMPRGGHFAAQEEPALLAEDITAFFESLN